MACFVIMYVINCFLIFFKMQKDRAYWFRYEILGPNERKVFYYKMIAYLFSMLVLLTNAVLRMLA